MIAEAVYGNDQSEQHDGFVGVMMLDLEKTTRMASEEVARISSLLAATSQDMLKCQTTQERKACVNKAMREYETAVKWIQVIVPHQEDDECEIPQTNSSSSDERSSGQPLLDLLNREPGGTHQRPRAGTGAPPPPRWSAPRRAPSPDGRMKIVPPPPSHPPTIPLSRHLPETTGASFHPDAPGSWSNRSADNAFSADSLGSWNNCSSRDQFNLDGPGSWSNRSSTTSLSSAHDSPHSSIYDGQHLPHQGSHSMFNLGLVHQQQQAQQLQHTQLQNPQFQHQMQQNQHLLMQPNAHQLHQQPVQRMQQSASMRQEQSRGMHCMSGVQANQANTHGSAHPMSGMQTMQTMQQPQQNDYSLVAVPVGTIPPHGAILAAPGTITATAPDQYTTNPDQFMPMSEIYQPNLCTQAIGGKFRIINPKTGEEVQGPNDKYSKRYRITHPGTGREVSVDEASDVENHELGYGFESRYYESSEIVAGDAYNAPSASWDWPLSRREIQERLDRIP